MEECDGWVIIPFQKTMVDSKTMASTYVKMVGVNENTFLVKREC